MSRWLILAVGLLGLACSVSTPKIVQNFSQLNYYRDSSDGIWREGLSVFVQVENKDGIGDLDKLYILNDEDEVFWELGPADWTPVDRPGENWLGSNNLWTPGQDELPRGNYRIQLVNKAGDRSESSFNINSPKLADFKRSGTSVKIFPDKIEVADAPPSYLVWVYTRESRWLLTYKAAASTLPLNLIMPDGSIRQQANKFFIYSFEEKLGVGVVQGPFYFGGQ